MGGAESGRDVRVADVTQAVLKPGWLTAGLLVIRAGESNDVRRNIEVLNRLEAPDLRRLEVPEQQEHAPTP